MLSSSLFNHMMMTHPYTNRAIISIIIMMSRSTTTRRGNSWYPLGNSTLLIEVLLLEYDPWVFEGSVRDAYDMQWMDEHTIRDGEGE